MSDLNLDDISNSELSDVEEAKKENNEDKEPKEESRRPAETAESQEERYVQENRRFMSSFVTTYKEDSQKAKANYYQEKLKFDLYDTKGKAALHKMLYRYLEGMQWVLFYYYRGA